VVHASRYSRHIDRKSHTGLSNSPWGRYCADHWQIQKFSNQESQVALSLDFGRWTQHVLQNHGALMRLPDLNGVTSRKAVIFSVTGVRTSNFQVFFGTCRPITYVVLVYGVGLHTTVWCGPAYCCMVWACILLYVFGVIYTKFRRSVRPFVCDPISVTKVSDFCEPACRRALHKLLNRLGFCENDKWQLRFTYWRILIYARNFHISRLICVKFSICCHVMAFKNCELRKIGMIKAIP
jgi:hypothetical protein